MHIGMGVGIGFGQPQWSPAALFAAGEQGAWYDYSDFSTMFQDSAGATPVTAAGQSVGKILDKSGRGNHKIQATGASCPTLQQDASGYWYLSFDGTDDSYGTAATIDFSATDKMSVFAGVRKASDAAAGILVELSANQNTNNGSFYLAAPASAAANYTYSTKGTIITQGSYTNAAVAAPNSSVITGTSDIGGDSAVLRRNGAQVAFDLSDQGAGNYGNYTLYVGRRGNASVPFNGRLYQLIVRGAASTAAQIANAERFVGAKMGIVL